MATEFKLRPYQERMVEAPFAAWQGRERPTGTGTVVRALLQAATGAGKTRMAGEIIRRQLEAGGGRGRALFLVHRDELAKQAFRAFREQMPHLSCGIVQAESDDYHRQVVIGSVPTLARGRRRAPICDVVVNVVDEAHHAVMGGTYESVLRHFGAFDRTPTLGITATPERADGKALGDVWEEVVARFSILDGIRGGYLTDVRGRRIRIRGLDLGQIKRQSGDLQATDLGVHLQDVQAAEQVLDGYLKYGDERVGVFFWPTVATAEEFAAECARRGIPCDVVTGTTPIHHHNHDLRRCICRAAMYERSRLAATNGEQHLLSNCMVLTEGFDAPWISLIGMARMTESRPLFMQIVGRGVRTWVNPATHAAKRDCILLDFTGVGARHKLAGFSDLLLSGDDEQQEREQLAEGDELLLTELDDEQRAAALEPPPVIPGEMLAREFDPFAGSASAWLQTFGGVPFLEVRNPRPRPGESRSFLLWLAPDGAGLWSIATCPADAPASRTAVVLEREMTFSAAQHHAEYLATRHDPSLAGKNAPWRDARTPTDAQRAAYARVAGFPLPSDLTRGQASDSLSVVVASRAIHS